MTTRRSVGPEEAARHAGEKDYVAAAVQTIKNLFTGNLHFGDQNHGSKPVDPKHLPSANQPDKHSHKK